MNEPADATPEEFVCTVIVLVESLNVPDAPDDGGAVKATFTPETAIPPASVTVTERFVPNAVLIAVDCGEVPELPPILYGTCATANVSVKLVASAKAPPPEAVAAFVVVDLRALLGTATVISISLNDEPPATASKLVQVIALVPEQVQPVPLKDAAVNPVGSVSVTVVVPAVDALPVFDTVMLSVPPVCPCVNVPLCASVTLRMGVVDMDIWSAGLSTVGVPNKPGAPSDTSGELSPPVALAETFKFSTSWP